jgi:competence protein ComEC
LIAGLAAAGSFGFCLPASYLPLLLAVTVLAIFLPANIIFLTAVNILVFFSGNIVMHQMLKPDAASRLALERHENAQLLLEGVIQARPETRAEGCRLLIRPDYIFSGKKELSLNGLVLLHIGSRSDRFASGNRIRFIGKLRAPRNFGIPGEFDAERYYALKGIVATSFVKNAESLVLMNTGDEYSFQRYFDEKAKNIGKFIMDCVPPVEGGILKALLIGDVGDIPQELKDAYSRTGVNHILSISGFHVGIIALALFQSWFVLFRLFPNLLLYLNFRRFVFAASFPLILYYMFLSGAAPATARSVLMLGFLTVGLLLEREFDHINSLILAALVLLLINPANLYDISFQLSFIALWGIMVLTPLFMGRFHAFEQKKGYNILLFLAASFAAITATMLPVAFYFHQTSLIGLVSNLFVVPLLGYGAVITGFLAIPLINFFPQASTFLFNLAGSLASLSNSIIALLDHLPLLPVFVPTTIDMVISIVALLVITIAEKNRLKFGVFIAAPLLMATLHYFPFDADNPALRIDFFSVGQGEATLITFHDRKRMLIDGGGALHDDGHDVGKRLLVPALRTLGVKRVDYLVLSHPHPDHMQGVTAVAEALPIGEFWESGATGGDGYQRLKKALAVRNVPVKRINAATPPLELSGARLQFLHPLPGESSENQGFNLNDDSLVFRLEAGSFSALFAGDIGYQEEKRLSLDPGLLKSTLLKVPHHGSKYSVFPEFFSFVSPEIALIGAGYRNIFGLPSPEAIERLLEVGCKIYRTDHDGTITIKIYSNSKSPVISALKSHFN